MKPSVLAVALLAAAACGKKEPAPTNQVTSAPIDPRPHLDCPWSDAPLAASSRAAIERALADERAAEARYDAVVQAFGPVMPFRQLQHAERRHSWALEELLVTHHAPIPPATAAPPAEPKSLREACTIGVEAEKKNVALYEELLVNADLPADVRCVFTHLRDASRERHEPALERCAGQSR
jgi:hypothetical protein